MKILKKCVGKELEVVDTNEKYLMDCGRKELFGRETTLERVYLDGFEFILVVDEDGLSKQLPLNFFMDFTNSGSPFPVQAIVGDVLFVRNKPCNPYEEEMWDFEVTDVTDKDIERVQKMLAADVQNRLYYMFRGLYGAK